MNRLIARTRWFRRWTSVTFAVLMAAAWTASYFWHVETVSARDNMLAFDSGNLTLRWHEIDRDVPSMIRPVATPGVWQYDISGPLNFPVNSIVVGGPPVWTPNRAFLWRPHWSTRGVDPIAHAVEAPDGSILEVRMGRVRTHSIVTPFWYIVVAAILTAWLTYRSTRRTSAPGLCPNCNYDMKGNQSGKCPECGTPTSASTGTIPNEAGVSNRGADLSDTLR